MALPNGYTQLEYIESSGTQYINTGFKPNQNTRIFAKVSGWPNTEKSTSLWGTQAGSGDRYDMYISSGGVYRSYFAGAYVAFGSNVSCEDVTEVERVGNTIRVGQSSLTNTAATFSCTTLLYLFAHNNNGVLNNAASFRLYSCQIYDNGTLVRDYAPAKRNSDGAVGLFDQANNEFYSNSGTGEFAEGAVVEGSGTSNNGSYARIAAADRPITECYVEIDGVRCQVPYGLTTIDGVTMTIPFGPSAETIEQYPSIVGNLTYTGSAQSPQWADYDSSKMSIGGTQSGTNAGSYTTTFTPLEGYVWPDGSTDAYSVTWSIAKAAGSVTLSKTSISLGVDERTTLTVTRIGDGAISVSSSAPGRATAIVSGTTVTVISYMSTGSATITVSVAEGTNHLAASATCAVTVAQMYTVTIGLTSGANMYPGNRNTAYFSINGTQYYGDNSVTLKVASGTSYRAYAKITNPMTQSEAGTVRLNNTEVARGGTYNGKITSNTTVSIGVYDYTSGTMTVSYATVGITTS